MLSITYCFCLLQVPAYSSSSSPRAHNVFPVIPVHNILKNIVDFKDQEILLTCRLISMEWNEIIENTSDIVRNITFPVWHPKPLLDLLTVKKKRLNKSD